MYYIHFAVIVAVIVAIIIGVSVKKKKQKMIESTGSEAAGKTDATEYKGPPVNMIYKYPGKHTSVNCPFCDGENKANAANCEICGEKI